MEFDKSIKVGICFVCLGNICRSPLAEGVFTHLANESGYDGRFTVESAGTASYHLGERPDHRTIEVARNHGIELRQRVRQFQPEDFARFDFILAMDRSNRADLLSLAATPAERAKVRLFRAHDPLAAGEADVPDPYYGGPDGFEQMYQMIDRSCRSLLKELSAR